MSSHLATEHDLRRTLQSLAPEDIDATQFRQRLDQLLDGQPPATQLPSEDDEATLLSMDWADSHSRSRTRRRDLTIAVALVACAAAVVTVFLAVVAPGHSQRRTPSPALTAPVPAAIRPMLLPGTVVLNTYAGHGSQTFVVPPRVIPPHFSYNAYGTCSGGGTIRIAQQTIFGACTNEGGAFGTDATVDNGRLVITADNATNWQITLAIAPDTQTNGGVQSPVDPDMTGPNNAVRQSGRGSGTVSFSGETPAPPAGSTYRLRLVCSGSGVTMPNLTVPRAGDALHTKTCFAGHEYVWDDLSLKMPLEIHIDAAPQTTWTIAINSM